MGEKVFVFDTTLRDGEQAPGYSMNLEEKLKMARQIEALGVDIIEAGFAISSPGDFESVRSIASIVRNATVCSLARSLKKDIDAAYEAVKVAVSPRLHVFLATSDIHLEYKLKLSRDEAFERMDQMVRYASSLCPDVEFSLEDATRTDREYMLRIVEGAIKAGARTINLPDTVGYSTPGEIYDMVRYVKEHVPLTDKAVLSMHCHNDLGMAVSNTLSGLEAGARQFECAISGIGERAGNAALEEVVMTLKTRKDKYGLETGINTKEIARSSHLLSSITGVKINPSKAIVGQNAFAHESGIHQHGVMAKRETYEIMTPEEVGVTKTNLILGKHSGIHAFSRKLEELGYYDIPDEEIKNLFSSFKALSDRKKHIMDNDIIALLDSQRSVVKEGWSLKDYVVNSGNGITSTACITLEKDGKKVQGVAIGTGPIYASFRCIEKIIKHPFSLLDYQLDAVTEHRDAQGQATVKVSDGKGTYRGRGLSTDVIEASLLALLQAVNRMLYEKHGEAEDDEFGLDEGDMLVGHTDKEE